jgi:CHAT domain-containing protein
VAERAAASIRNGVDVDALHAIALIDLADSDTAGNSLHQSISYLEMTTRLSPTSSSAFTDLAAAQLANAAGRGGAVALLAAIEASSRALMLTPRGEGPLYDRALALDLLGLDDQASMAWRAYLAIDSRSQYANVARRRLGAIATHVQPLPPKLGSPAVSFAAYARRSSGDARRLAFEELLGEWGTATVSGDSVRARSELASAVAIARTLEDEHHDVSTKKLVDAIGRARTPAARRRLAAFHVRYANAQKHARVNEYDAADSVFREILAAQPPSPALVAWARLAHANALIYLQRPLDALAAARSGARETDARREPLLMARLLWLEGVLASRRLQTDTAMAKMQRAAELFTWFGDQEFAAGALGVVGEALLRDGAPAPGYAAVYHALALLRPYPASLWRHNVLLVLSRSAARDGYLLAALAVENEDAVAAGAGIRAASVVEARASRARRLMIAGDRVSARAAILDARRALVTVPAGSARQQLGHELDLAVASEIMTSEADRARRLIDSALSFFAPLPYSAKSMEALVARAAVGIAQGDVGSATGALQRAEMIFDSTRMHSARPERSSPMLLQARRVFDDLLMLAVRAGDTRYALVIADQRRQAFAPWARPGEGRQTTPKDKTLIEFGLIGDTLLTWVLRGADTCFVRATVDEQRLESKIEEARSGLELGASAETLHPLLGRLFDLLLAPVESHLGPAGSDVVIVADGPLGDIPFAALWDVKRREYVVARYATQLVPTLGDVRVADTTRGPAANVLFVADPRLEGRAFPTLSPLAGAVEEVRFASTLYPTATTLGGAKADSANIVAALGTAELFHFAGHAILDDADPDRSYLAVRPHGLGAKAIAHLDLHRLQLVVLSACETVRSPDRRAGGFAGFADAFLAAGARGVIGSLWSVDDTETRQLMEAFYLAYRRDTSAPRALRAAQLSILGAGVSSPRAWAGFRYAGR